MLTNARNIRRQVLIGVLAVLVGGYLLGPELLVLGPAHYRIDLAAVGIRLIEIDTRAQLVRGFGVADLREPVSAEDYVAIATILLALATVVLAFQTRTLVAGSKRELGYLASQAESLRDNVKLAGDSVEAVKAAETRRNIVELRQLIHTLNAAAIKLESTIAAAEPLTTTMSDTAEKIVNDAVADARSTCEPLFSRTLALIDDLPFVSNEVSEAANEALVDLAFLRTSARDRIHPAIEHWGKVRVDLLTVIDSYQGKTRTWKPWKPMIPWTSGTSPEPVASAPVAGTASAATSTEGGERA